MTEKFTHCTEGDLWMAFKEGDEQAYEFMFKHYYKTLFNYGLKINSNREEIKDCIQQLFAGLWESRLRLGSCTSVKSYLLASLRRILLRRLKVRFQYINIDQVSPSFQVETSVESKYIRQQGETERAKVLSRLITRLPDRQKEALYLRFYADHSFGEIAQIMGITTRGVYKLVYKALDHLSLEIAEKKFKISDLLSIMLF